jgi:chemotaxis protein histidine kinase CheA
LEVEEIDARAALGVSANASKMEIKAAYRKLIAEVQERYDDATDLTTRQECRRKRRELDEARRTLIPDSEYIADFDDQEQRRREEEERRDTEQRQREEQERLEREQRQREEQERLVAEQRQRQEQERQAAQQRQQEQERLAAEQRQREEQERQAAQQRQQEQERLAAEQRQREEQERQAAQQRQQEQERFVAEQRQREEQERLEREQREEQERLAREQREREEKQRRSTIRLLIGALVLLLAAASAAVVFWVQWQNQHKLGKLVLNTLPANAGVFVDGVSRGTTPLVLDGISPGERHLRIELEGYQDEQLIVLIEPGAERFLPLVTLIPKKEPVSTVTPAPTSPTVSPAPSSPTITPAPTSPSVAPAPTLPTVTPAPSGFPGERFPQTRLRILTEAEVANLDYDDLQYAINEMYARHAAQFLKDPDVRKQFERFTWYYPMPGMTLSRIDREFSRIESQNRDLLARLRDQKRPK